MVGLVALKINLIAVERSRVRTPLTNILTDFLTLCRSSPVNCRDLSFVTCRPSLVTFVRIDGRFVLQIFGDERRLGGWGCWVGGGAAGAAGGWEGGRGCWVGLGLGGAPTDGQGCWAGLVQFRDSAGLGTQPVAHSQWLATHTALPRAPRAACPLQLQTTLC
jgi:hypothetical protein